MPETPDKPSLLDRISNKPFELIDRGGKRLAPAPRWALRTLVVASLTVAVAGMTATPNQPGKDSAIKQVAPPIVAVLMLPAYAVGLDALYKKRNGIEASPWFEDDGPPNDDQNTLN